MIHLSGLVCSFGSAGTCAVLAFIAPEVRLLWVIIGVVCLALGGINAFELGIGGL